MKGRGRNGIGKKAIERKRFLVHAPVGGESKERPKAWTKEGLHTVYSRDQRGFSGGKVGGKRKRPGSGEGYAGYASAAVSKEKKWLVSIEKKLVMISLRSILHAVIAVGGGRRGELKNR